MSPAPRTGAHAPGARRHPLERLAQERAHLAHVRQQRRVGDALEHVAGDRGHERSAAEGGAVVAGLDGRGDLRVDEHRAHRQPAGERLGERDHVGGHARGLVGEQGAQPTEPALDLVEDEGDAPLGR
jgi:hypothetical protein